jgi:tetratricopeptide (TPR) repeat protein
MNNESIKNQLLKALKAHQMGNIDAADQVYIEILKIDESNFDANHLHGLVLSQKRKYSESIEYYEKAYSVSKENVELLNNYAISLRNLNSFKKSTDLLKYAININSSFIKSYLNLANCYQTQNKLIEGLEVIQEGRIILPESDELITREITCYLEIYNKYRKGKHLKKVISLIDNSDIESSKDIKYLSFCSMAYIWSDQLEKANKLFKLTEKLSQITPSVDSLEKVKDKNTLKTFVKHEYEQLCHVDSDIDGIRNMKISQPFFNKIKNLFEKDSINYSDNELETISAMHKILYNKPIKLKENFLNPNLNISQIESDYKSSNPEIVVIDDFLSEKFLKEINIFFRCANIFKRPYPRGYIGTFLNTGMSNMAILQFSQELKHKFKNILDEYHLIQAWAFKYDSDQKGINIHADDAKVNINFWITENESNLDKNSGGMIIWKKKPNINQSFDDFNSSETSNRRYDEVKNIDSIKVPYKANRVVIFNSKLYHATDEINFKNSYINRRVNVTLLYD